MGPFDQLRHALECLTYDWEKILQHHEQYVNENLCNGNWKQHRYDYAPGQNVLKVQDPIKGARTTGADTKQAHVNCIFATELHPGFTEFLNINNIIP